MHGGMGAFTASTDKDNRTACGLPCNGVCAAKAGDVHTCGFHRRLSFGGAFTRGRSIATLFNVRMHRGGARCGGQGCCGCSPTLLACSLVSRQILDGACAKILKGCMSFGGGSVSGVCRLMGHFISFCKGTTCACSNGCVIAKDVH